MAVAKKSTGIELPPIKLVDANLTIIGDSPLIVHAWSQKAREEMLRKQMKLPTQRETKNPIEAFERSMYRLEDGGHGIPAVGVKNAMVTACTSVEGITKVAARQAFYVIGEMGRSKAAFADLLSPQDLVRVLSPNPPAMREDMVRLSGPGNSADLRYRAEYRPWAIELNIRFNAGVISLEQLMNLLNTAGFGVGLCEWRMERNGQYGTFHVANEDEADMVASKEWHKNHAPVLPDVEGWLTKINAGAPTEGSKVKASAKKSTKKAATTA